MMKAARLQSSGIVTSAVCVVLLMLLAVAVPYAATLILLLVAACSLLSVKFAMRAIGVLVLVRMANPALLGDLMGPITLVGWIVFLLAGLRIYVSASVGRNLLTSPIIFLAVFTIVTAVLSFFASDYFSVSLFKLISFSFGAGFVFLGFRYLASRDISLLPDLVGMWLGVLVVSMPLVAVPSVGYFRDGLGFQGITNHPQLLAAFCAPILVWSGIYLLLRGARASWLVLLIFVLSLIEIFFTRGRTAIAAAGLAGVVAFIFAFVGSKRWLSEISVANIAPRVIAVIAIIAVGIASYANVISEVVVSFVFKREVDVSLSESFQASRGLLIIEELENFRQNPWLGIGFGVSRSAIHPFEPVVEPTTGFAIGAATEKSNIVVALLEEVGIVGTAAFLPLCVAIFRRMKASSPFSLGGAALAAFFINISEMVFFSMGAMGLYVFIVLGISMYYPVALGVRGGMKIKMETSIKGRKLAARDVDARRNGV